MSIAAAWPAAGQPFTTDALDRMPDDGRRYEQAGQAAGDQVFRTSLPFPAEVVAARLVAGLHPR